MVEWLEIYSVKNEEIDEQHKMLIDILHQLDQALEVDDNTYLTVVELIKRLESYVKHHFEYEESIMEKISYPYIKEHTDAHNSFRYKIQTTYAFDIEQPNQFHREMIEYLTKWLIKHIMNVDLILTNYISEQKVIKKPIVDKDEFM